jgi:hypothetical protein
VSSWKGLAELLGGPEGNRMIGLSFPCRPQPFLVRVAGVGRTAWNACAGEINGQAEISAALSPRLSSWPPNRGHFSQRQPTGANDRRRCDAGIYVRFFDFRRALFSGCKTSIPGSNPGGASSFSL